MSDGGELVVRPAGAADRDAIRRVTLAAYAEYAATMTAGAWHGLEGAVHRALEHEADAAWLVAERAGEVVGSVAIFPTASDAYHGATAPLSCPELRLLAVAPEARGHGVGRALVDACVARARAMGAPALGLHTSKTMRVAIGMYERMGFARAPEHDFRPGDGEHVKAYRLPL